MRPLLSIAVSTVLVIAFAASYFTLPKQAHATGTWNTVVSDSFSRANSSTIGNGWVDAAGVGSIVSNALVLTAPSSGAGVGTVRILRPTSEATTNQRVDVTSTLADTNGGISQGVVLRAKSVVIDGIDISPALTVTLRHSGSLSFALAYNGWVDFPGSGVTGTTSFTPTIGHSYTLSVSVLNNFPAVITATVNDNTTSTQVANASYNVSGEYGTQDLSPYWKTAGVAGLTMEGTAGQSVTLSNVTTYSYGDSGTFTAPTAPLNTQHDSKTYLATPLPSGGTAPYTVRWYRGANGFTPPVAIDGTGSGTGTFLGTGQEVIDTTAPTGVSNFSLSYRPVFFDSAANATTGILGSIINLNSPSVKSIASLMWVGDSITFGYQTSNGQNSPASYADTALAADSSLTSNWLFKLQDRYSYEAASAPKVYRTDGGAWTALSDSSVNTATHTVTASTSGFSTFALLASIPTSPTPTPAPSLTQVSSATGTPTPSASALTAATTSATAAPVSTSVPQSGSADALANTGSDTRAATAGFAVMIGIGCIGFFLRRKFYR